MAQHKLVIAEKPSVAQSLAAVIGATARKDGYLEGNGWRVSWCVGHLDVYKRQVQKTIIDRCVRLVYQTYLNDPRPENMPILEDLYNLLRAQDEKEAQYIATALEIYVTGSLNVFNHQSNVDINNRIVCYDIKELGKQLKKIGMLVVQDQVWGRVTANRNRCV